MHGFAMSETHFPVRFINEYSMNNYNECFCVKIEAPGSPKISVTTGATSLIVRWDPPAYDGGSSVTGYLVEIINGTLGILITNSTTSSSKREVKIVKLRKNTNYTVWVKARNVVSYGKAAEIFTKTKFVGGYNCDICHFTYMYGVHVLSIRSGLFGR